MRAILVLVFMCISGCEQTKEISHGTYGPFAIGDNKVITLEKVIALEKTEAIRNMLFIEPIPSREVYLDGPTEESIHAVDENNGILVWLDHYPWPLRIELKDNVVVNTWGASEKCMASQPSMNIACSEIKRLANKIIIGSSRNDIYKTITSFDTELSKQIGNFVVGLQEFRTGGNKSETGYTNLILANDAWQFNGLKQLSRFKNPFYSRVTLYFDKSHLSKIRHWSAPYEMP
ncbi:hypothetical protein [Methylobacter sp.]|uniref:hypothetical protein n=1 Tax=Methylobacter sp. TaxID=2051955 RepID=UPI0011F9D00F|nr:hypothetical protein [Methylobacter sp.]TAK61526.1 MAG: hypothetical protein EPO18_13560 [Methylobacter sp.]